MCLMCLKPRSIPWNMTVNMAEALPQWSSDARHPSEVCDGCTNQTHRATLPPGILPYYAALTSCMLLSATLFKIIPPSAWKTKEQSKMGVKQKEEKYKTWTCDKLWNPLNCFFDPAAVDVMIYPVLMLSLCFIPGKITSVCFLHASLGKLRGTLCIS